jgi:hypothetical protein
MNVDHFFTIGAPHASQGRPCEDYARSGLLAPGCSFGVVADGCSGAAASTEVGAQALAFAFERILLRRPTEAGACFDDAFADQLIADVAAHRISAADADYVATVAGFAADDTSAAIYIFGDGATALRYTDGRCRLVEIEWANNMPYYLAYRWHPEWRQAFVAQLAGDAAPACLRTTTFRAGANGIEILDHGEEPLFFDTMAGGFVMRVAPAAEGIETLAVFTDGISRVGSLSAAEAAAELLAFKNLRGEFVKRRCIRALKGLERTGRSLGDDLGIACVSFGSD